jgi:hypothetical protein
MIESYRVQVENREWSGRVGTNISMEIGKMRALRRDLIPPNP